MKTFDSNTVYVCRSKQERQQLLDFAESCGIPVINRNNWKNFRTHNRIIFYDFLLRPSYLLRGEPISKDTFMEYCRNYKTMLCLKML